MPRKKPLTDAPLTAPEPPAAEAASSEAPIEAPKRPRGRPRKTPAPEAPVAEAAVPEAVAPAKPKATRRTKAAKTASDEPATPLEAAPTEAPKRRGRPAKVAAPAPEPAAEEKPKRGRKPKASAEPVAATLAEDAPLPETSPEPEPTGDAFDLGDGRALAVTFRASSRGVGGPPAPAETAGEPERSPEPAAAAALPLPMAEEGEEPLPTFTFRARSAETRPPKAEKAAGEAPAPPSELVFEAVGEEEMPLIAWRPKGSGTPTPESEDEGAGFAEEGDGRRRRRRGRGGRRDEDVPDAEETPTAFLEGPASKDVPQAAGKTPEPLAIPPDAPQVVLRNGVPVLVRDGRAFPPLAFCGDPTTGGRAEALTMEQVRMAGVDGVHLHVLALPVTVDASGVGAAVERASATLAKASEADAEAQAILLVEFLAPHDADRRFPDAAYRGTDGRPAAPSVCDEGYWGEAAAVLRGLAEGLKDDGRLMGFQLGSGWLHPEAEGYDASPAAAAKFRAWARTRYGNDVVALRAAWFDGAARFDTITPPTAEDAARTGDRFIRSGRRGRRVVDYHLFLSDATAARLADLAIAVKEASAGCLLVGVDYGATLEGSHPSGGHLALGKVMRTPEIDFVAGPPSYATRGPGGSAAFAAPVDSFPLNGKLYLSVEDYRTSLGGNAHPGEDVLRTPQALESLHWRGVGAALAHGMGVAWTDANGEGSLRSNSVWDRASRVLEALTLRMGTPMGDPEVAVFLDERALAYLVDDDAFELLVREVRESILRAGVSAAFYLLSDLAHREHFPDSKLYLFLNAWDIRPETRAAIKTRLQRDGKVLFWTYAASLFDSGRDSLERAREVTGIALKPQPFASRAGTTLLNRRHPLTEAFPERTVSGHAALEPTYFAIPEDALVLGEYTQTGLPSFVVREFGVGGPAEERWTSVFLGEPRVTSALVRALAQMAGAHVWDFSEDVVHVRPPFLTVHCKGTGGRTVALPAKEAAYDLVARQWVTMDGANLRFIGVDGATHAFLVGPRAEIEHLLSTDPAQTLRVESLPPRELNVRKDAADFDVPIMRLGEFIGNAEGEESADEWFLRPNPEVEETAEAAQAEEAPGEVGRRRRRRGGRGGRDREERETTSESSPEPAGDAGISVVFRKRQ